MSARHRSLLFSIEMIVASFSSRQKLCERQVFSNRKPLFRRRFLSETQWLAHDDVERARFEFLFKTEGSNALLCSLAEGSCKTNIMSKLYKSKHHLSYRASAMYKNIYPRWYFLMILTWRRLGGASVMTAKHALRKMSGSRINCKTQYVVKLGIRPLLCCDVQDKLHVAPQDKTVALRTAKTLLPMVRF